MRLSSIKLAGFKSFVDPVNFQLPSQLVGVVGPNGCGKSNIIDAVRWVLGESRAAELRGESMQDVIFNGSTQRKPAGRASVELVFDNTDGRVVGQWGQYAEIAVKRVLTRDGVSSYHINNQVVRRRDIQDIFMGTGLGPRAYAIIGQGMIARIIEAKPDELRVFLEEAAGVSKYKERRRETENRLSDTRDNLTRVEDIRRELDSNLNKLEHQATVALQYQTLQTSGAEKTNLLSLLRKQEAQSEQDRHHAALNTVHNQLEGQTAALRHLEAEIEVLRSQHYTATNTVNEAQGALYEVNAVVTRLEAEIKFVSDARTRLQAQIASMEAQRAQWRTQAEQASENLVHMQAEYAQAMEELVIVEDTLASHTKALPEIETSWRSAQTQLTEQRSLLAQIEQQLKLEAVQRHNAEQRLQQLQARYARLQTEQQNLVQADDAALRSKQSDAEDLTAQLETTQDDLQAEQVNLAALELARADRQQQVVLSAEQVARLEARLAALQALQEQLRTEGKIAPWLLEHNLNDLPHLWEKIQIDPGWENALEAVLRERLFAIEVTDLNATHAFADSVPPEKIAFYSPPLGVTSVPKLAGCPLLQLVKTQDAGVRALLQDWLAGVYLADSFEAALASRDNLPVGALLVVREGHLLSHCTVQLYAQDSEKNGMLAREQEIDNLDKQCRAQQLLHVDAKNNNAQAETAYQTCQAQVRNLQMQVDRFKQTLHATQLEVLSLSTALAQYQQRNSQIDEELADIALGREEQQALCLQAEENLRQNNAQLGTLQAQYQESQGVFDALDAQLLAARSTLRALEHEGQEANFLKRNLEQRIAEFERIVRSANEQDEYLITSLEDAHGQADEFDEQMMQNDLQSALEQRAAKEAVLVAVRTDMDNLGHQLRQSDESRLSLEHSLAPMRDRMTALQLKEQAARLAQEQFSEQLKNAQADEVALMQMVTPNLTPANLAAEVTRIQTAMSSLGAVNMAALEELQVAKERKTFLDAQSEDLIAASHTLEDAIRKIDSETRALLQGTFDRVNQHFGELFPALFGGGQASLVMTGDEILDSGVQVLAQPPGKKNTTIQLLSGGEKALTAIALVFSMFLLNPAPFCLLDEVDAPLDDANTERYAKMVRRMSTNTQFVFISHNKIAMEIAEQLIGVTMQEQGVSRVVAVDMADAISFAEVA
ncbi:MAG: chromosome segregation protein SMC [Ottowia sp.]|nr:chromosome segregation protein SMC [Ottowia sp.]